MITRSSKRTLPPDAERDLRRLLRMLASAPSQVAAPPNGGDTDSLSQWLYTSWYSALERWEETPVVVAGRENLAPALRASLGASTQWDRGWVALRSTPTGMCVAGRADQTRELRPGEFMNLARPGIPVAPGDALAVTAVIDWVDEQTGFWCAKSQGGELTPPLVRAYFSVRFDQVGFVLRELSTTLDQHQLHYSLKCPSGPAGYSRVDTLVVYLEAASWPAAGAAVKAVAKRVQAHLRTMTPPLTKRIAPGAAFAEDPGNNESFGQSRCRILASGIPHLLREKRPSPRAAMMTLAKCLSAAGIDLRKPWLNPVQA